MSGEWLLYYLVRKSCIIYFLIISLILSVSFPQTVKSQYLTSRFEYFSVEDGLPDNMVTWFLQDHLGFLWIGTHNGLVRYDGYNFVTYKHNPNDISSIDNPFIFTLYEDKDEVLWIGTWYGLEKFNRATETFVHYTFDTYGHDNEVSSEICPIHEDKYGKLWVGGGNGLYKFGRTTEKFTAFRYDSTDRIAKEALATLKIFNVIGEEVATLVNTEKSGGVYEINFNAASLPSGVYFYQLKAGPFVQTKKMVLNK